MNKNIKNICVFCSASDFLSKEYYEDAQSLGRLIGQNGYNIVYGGSTLGLMWKCAGEVQIFGGKVYGVMPEKLAQMGCKTDNCDYFYLCKGMRDRKAKMDELSQAVIVMPGGFGTLEEFSEMFVQKQLGYTKKAIVLLNTNGFFDKLLEFFDTVIEEKFANKFVKELLFIANSPQEAINYINNYKEPDRLPTKEEIYKR